MLAATQSSFFLLLFRTRASLHRLGNGDHCRTPFTPLARLCPGQQRFLISGNATKCLLHAALSEHDVPCQPCLDRLTGSDSNAGTLMVRGIRG